METFQVHILAADRIFYEGPCVSLTVPTSDGERGILAHHENMMAAVQPGTLRWQPPEQGVQLAAVSPGMVKVEHNDVLVLVDSAERPEEIDEARARRIQRFLAQPTHVAEKFTGIPGVYVPLKDTLESFAAIVDGELDQYPEAAFYNVGTWHDVVEKARKMEGE